MGQLLGVLIVLAIGALIVGLAQRSWAKEHWSGSGGGGPFGAVDEIFAPARHQAMQELKEQYDRTAPAPVPGDPPWMDVDLDGEDGPVVTISRQIDAADHDGR